jgi:hypothetical protein
VWLQELAEGGSEARYRRNAEILRCLPYTLCNIGVITSSARAVDANDRKEIVLSAQPISDTAENDLKFQWLLCLDFAS